MAAITKGTPVYAGGNGIIDYIGRNGSYGKYIRIRHNNEYKTAYAHLSNFKKGIVKNWSNQLNGKFPISNCNPLSLST